MRCTACWFSVVAVCLVAGDGPPTGEDVIRLAPAVDSSVRDSMESARIDVKIHGDHPIVISAAYRKPEFFAGSLVDASDGLPFVFASDGKAIVYDPTSGRVVLLKYCTVRFAIQMHVEKIGFDFLYGGTLFDFDTSSRLVVNLRGILEEAKGSARIVKDGPDRARFVLTSMQGSKVDLDFNKRKQRLENIVFSPVETGQPALTIRRFVVDERWDPGHLRFPTLEGKPADITTEEFVELKSSGLGLTPVDVLHFAEFRGALRHPEQREQFATRYGWKGDWEKAKAADERVAKWLKALLKGRIETLRPRD